MKQIRPRSSTWNPNSAEKMQLPQKKAVNANADRRKPECEWEMLDAVFSYTNGMPNSFRYPDDLQFDNDPAMRMPMDDDDNGNEYRQVKDAYKRHKKGNAPTKMRLALKSALIENKIKIDQQNLINGLHNPTITAKSKLQGLDDGWMVKVYYPSKSGNGTRKFAGRFFRKDFGLYIVGKRTMIIDYADIEKIKIGKCINIHLKSSWIK